MLCFDSACRIINDEGQRYIKNANINARTKITTAQDPAQTGYLILIINQWWECWFWTEMLLTEFLCQSSLILFWFSNNYLRTSKKKWLNSAQLKLICWRMSIFGLFYLEHCTRWLRTVCLNNVMPIKFLILGRALANPRWKRWFESWSLWNPIPRRLPWSC